MTTYVQANIVQPKGANPHHLIFIADPQITDPHSYPGSPIAPLLLLIFDNFLLRSFRAISTSLRPDSVFFLGDLFDGGREWATSRGEFVDPKWGRQRAKDEKKLVDTWHRKYGEDYWLHEYGRFGDIFFDHFNDGGEVGGAWQRGRKLVASLPGNHDLGFGAQVQLSVRNRFEAFFGDVNRVDVVGNHTIVSVDSVSLSADTSEFKDIHDLTPIYGPVNKFLDEVKTTKRKAVQEELSVWHGTDRGLHFNHRVDDLQPGKPEGFPNSDSGSAADFPTILLTHVPLYRDSGTPCGPHREKYPPAKPPKGQTHPVTPDHRNAISVTGGYQYQNVLSEADSIKLVEKVGNVVHVFSGDDHDYCELVHSSAKRHVREITVKSLGMNMGVPTPGFVMASLWNPVDVNGKSIGGETTIQTHLCLLPNQMHTWMKYLGFGIFTLVTLTLRALLVPVLNLMPFALDAEPTTTTGLPVFKDKVEPPVLHTSRSHARTSSLTALWQSNRRGWQASRKRAPRINVEEQFSYDSRRGGKRIAGVVGREVWTSCWRVVWMALGVWLLLSRER